MNPISLALASFLALSILFNQPVVPETTGTYLIK